MDRSPPQDRPTLRVAGAGAAALAALALSVHAAPAHARQPLITGSLDRPGTVVVVGGGKKRTVRTGKRFKVRPPARVVTIRVRARKAARPVPLVVERRGRRAVVGVRAGARLGRIRVLPRYAAPVRRLPGGSIARRSTIVLAPAAPSAARREAAQPGATGTARAPEEAGDEEDEFLGVERDELALIVAAAAAVLALAALLIHFVRWLRQRRKRVDVDVRLGLPVYHQGAGQWAVFIEVFNHTDHAIRWTSAALELKDGRRAYLIDYPAGGELPAVIQPNESHETWVEVGRLERSGLYLDQPVIAAVKTDSGAVYRSKRRRLRGRS